MGRLDGTTIVEAAALADATAEQVYGPDLVLNRPSRFGLGFQLTQPERPLGPGESAFGHFGAGGSLGFCDPDAGLAFGYVMNVSEFRPPWSMRPFRAPVLGELWKAGMNRMLFRSLMRLQGIADIAAVSHAELGACLYLMRGDDHGRAFLRRESPPRRSPGLTGQHPRQALSPGRPGRPDREPHRQDRQLTIPGAK